MCGTASPNTGIASPFGPPHGQPSATSQRLMGLTCLGLTVVLPLSAQQPKLRHTLKGHKQ
jgi:hypothetical protein